MLQVVLLEIHLGVCSKQNENQFLISVHLIECLINSLIECLINRPLADPRLRESCQEVITVNKWNSCSWKKGPGSFKLSEP